jgi:GNAT superfamily N-acetyltransferase
VTAGVDRNARLEVRPVTPDVWPDLLSFFGPSGAYSNCWCTWWRQTSPLFQSGCRGGGAGNRELMRRITEEGRVPGLLAYSGGEPVGWISVAPRREFGRVLRSPNLKPVPDQPAADVAGAGDVAGAVWSIVCFWIPREQRRRGVAAALLDAAVAYAADQGAERVEAYPIDTRGARASSAEIFTGTLEMFQRAGFAEVRRRADKRPVVQRALRLPASQLPAPQLPVR